MARDVRLPADKIFPSCGNIMKHIQYVFEILSAINMHACVSNPSPHASAGCIFLLAFFSPPTKYLVQVCSVFWEKAKMWTMCYEVP